MVLVRSNMLVHVCLSASVWFASQSAQTTSSALVFHGDLASSSRNRRLLLYIGYGNELKLMTTLPPLKQQRECAARES